MAKYRTRRMTRQEIEDFRKEAHLIWIANPLPDGSRMHVDRIYHGPDPVDLKRIKEAEKHRRKTMRSKMVAEFTLEDVYAALMELLAKDEPGVVRQYAPVDWDYTPPEEGESPDQGTFVLTLEPRKVPPKRAVKRTKPAGDSSAPNSNFPSDDEIRGYLELRPDLIPPDTRPQMWGGKKLRDWYLMNHRELLATQEVQE